MGLLEKRALKAYQDSSYKKQVENVNAAAGYPIEFEVNWDSLMIDDHSAIYDDCFTKVYFLPVIKAFKEITVDDMGKEGLKATVKKIVIKNVGGYYSAGNAYDIKDGVLTIDHQPCTNVDDNDQRANALATLLMKQM